VVVSAVLDACVLYPVGLRDTLLNLAEAGCLRVFWTEQILAETSRNIVADIPGLTPEHLDKTFAAMRRAFPEAMVEGYEHLVDSMTNHPGDRHVLAAAVAAEADTIVTINTRHFSAEACEPHGVSVQTPDALLCDLADTWPQLVVAVLSAQAARKTRPPMSMAEMLDRLEAHVPVFVTTVRRLTQQDGPSSPTG